MKSVDFRNDPMFLRNQFARDGTFEMPVIKKTKLDLDDIEFIGYDKLNEGAVSELSPNFPAGIPQNVPGKVMSGAAEASLDPVEEAGTTLKQRSSYFRT